MNLAKLHENNVTRKQKLEQSKIAERKNKNRSGALWGLINHILTPEFFNYVFMCDTDDELKLLKRFEHKFIIY